MEQTLLGFDYGLKRIGVAVGQTVTKSATPLPTLNANNGIPNWQDVAKLIEGWRPQALVVGMPLKLDDTEQPITHRAREFAEELARRFNLTVYQVDERFTTKEARSQVFERGGYKSLQETEIDGIAAKLILEDWLKRN